MSGKLKIMLYQVERAIRIMRDGVEQVQLNFLTVKLIRTLIYMDTGINTVFCADCVAG